MKTSRVVGTGSAFPSRVVTNDELCESLRDQPGEVPEGFSPVWIEARTGVHMRHFSRPGVLEETNRELGTLAAARALEMAGIRASEVDGVIYATCTPDFPMPASAVFVQKNLGTRGFAFDLNAACSGFQHALAVGHSLIANGDASTLLLVGTDVLSPLTNFRDRKSCILFGDGAGAAVLTAEPRSSGRGIVSSKMHADGDEWDLFHVQVGGTDSPLINPAQQYEQARMQMKGNEIFKASVRTMVALAEAQLAEQKLSTKDVSWIIPHQANLRILESVAKRLDVPMDRVIVNLRERGNTSAATVPTALDEAVRAGKISEGDLCLINVFGAGVTSGVTLMRW